MTAIIRDAIAYVGDNQFAGKVEECALPDIEFDPVEIKALGMLGAQEFAGALKPLKGSMKFYGVEPDILTALGNPRIAQTLLLRSSQERVGVSGVLEEVPVAWTLAPRFLKQGLGTLGQADAPMPEWEFTTSSLLVEIGGTEALRIDIADYVYAVGGRNLFADKRAALGL